MNPSMMYRSSFNKIRSIEPDIVKYYEININDYEPITLKAYKIVSDNGKEYFLKETNAVALQKYQYLYNQGVNNVIYPILNRNESFVTRANDSNYYISDYVKQIKIRNDTRVSNLYNELSILHQQTQIRKSLDPSKSRGKFDELSSQLDYKFRLLEQLVRKIEAKNLDTFTLPILENYHYILDAKKELVKLQKRLISSIKAHEGVNYSFIHNNPDLDHLLNIKGVNYLSSLDNGKIGINSLDMAKFYVMNEQYDIDFKQLILDKYYDENQLFYYDYFRFLVLVIYIKRMPITIDDYINANSFVDTSESIKRYFKNFLDYKEETS